jgi:integrating conjugative element protein (TIGR03756 family)
LALSILLACGPSVALDTGSITSSVLSPNCLEYRVVGICFWLFCTPFGCTVKTSTKVRHFIPELVVSSYATTGNNPWTEMATLSSPISGAEGGGNLITPNTRRDNLLRFKNVDGIGHPGGWAATQLASQSGYACASGATAFMPYYLSTLDSLAWRHGIPESFYPESLMPGIREIGRQASGNMWGNVYPRQGFLVQPDDFKAAAVMAQRAGDVITRNWQPHVYYHSRRPNATATGRLARSSKTTLRPTNGNCSTPGSAHVRHLPQRSGTERGWRLRLVVVASL